VDNGAVVWGLILIVVGGWFFLDQTLGFEMPDLDWSAIWPIGLIVIGAAVILQGLGRRRK
jgi:TRAP-type C4-dicarboxylate transport system permease small subunit